MYAERPFARETWEDLIQDFTQQDVQYLKAIQCPCSTDPRRGADPTCTVCDGTGFLYESAATCKILLTSFSKNRELTNQFPYTPGDVVASIPAEYEDTSTSPSTRQEHPAFGLAEHDRVIRMEGEEVIRQQFKRSGTSTTLRATSLVRVEYIRKITAGVLVTLVLNVDYSVSGSTITWLSGSGYGGNAPAEGEKVSIEFVRRPEFVVHKELPMVRHVAGEALPRRLHLKIADMVLRGRAQP